MPDFFKTVLTDGPAVAPGAVLLRLLTALALGGGVAWIYRSTRSSAQSSPSFTITLVLLSVLIAMVTQVIGDNVARAFSLVGALSIVRFRTIVRDTQDTAYVIFSVVVGMAVGAHDLWVALIGIGVVGLAAWLMSTRGRTDDPSRPTFLLMLRLALGNDVGRLFETTLKDYLQEADLVSISTTKQGLSVEVTYQARMRSGTTPDQLLRFLNHLEGVQRVELRRRGFVEE